MTPTARFIEDSKTLRTLDQFIAYLETTNEDEWCLGVVRTDGNKANCMFGHLVNWWHGKGFEGNIGEVWDMFEEIWATTYMVYPVNDGENMKYQQDTPKERVIAYLRALNEGKEKTTQVVMNETLTSIKTE